jgi:ribosome modulation factor
MKAAHAGVASFADGIAESSCPHKVATLTYSAWRKGWQEARDRAGP